MDPAHAALARRMMDLGVNLKGGDLAQSPFAKYLYSNLSKVPFSGAGAAMAYTESSWNRALTHQLGEDAPRVTPEVLGAAKSRIGAGYDSVTPKLTIAPSDTILSKLADVTHEASSTLPEDQAAPIQKITDQFLSGFKDGQPMDGEAVHNFLKKGAPLSRMENSQDPNVRFYAGQVRSAINDELAAQAPPEARAQLQQLNSQYKVLKTLEPLVKKSPTGDISPASLMTQVAKHYPGMAYGQAGPMADLARGGQAFLKPPPSSGTAERELLFKIMGGLGGIGAGYELGKGNPRALLAIPAIAAGARGIQKGMNSPAYRNALLRSAPDNYLMPPE